MNVLEKILEEIEKEQELAREEMRRCLIENPLQFDEVKGYVRGCETVLEIIRSYIDSGKDTDVPSNDEIEPVSEEFLKDCAETAKKYKRENDGWIPVEKRLPEELQKVLVWYEYFRYGEYNCMYQTHGIGWQLDGYWSGDVSGTKARCIAWQKLPEPYKPEEPKQQKNTQREMEDFWRISKLGFNRGEKGECDRGNFNTCDVSFGW